MKTLRVWLMLILRAQEVLDGAVIIGRIIIIVSINISNTIVNTSIPVIITTISSSHGSR